MTRVFGAIAIFVSLSIAPLAAAAAESPAQVAGATTVTPEQAYELFDQNAVFVDVRKASDFDAGRIPGAVLLDVNTAFTQSNLGAVAGPSEPVVVYCNGRSCLRSSKAAELAVGWGYVSVFYLRDGYPGWEAAGFPIE